MRFWRKRAHGGGEIVHIVLFRPCHRPKKKKEKAARLRYLVAARWTHGIPDGICEFSERL